MSRKKTWCSVTAAVVLSSVTAVVSVTSPVSAGPTSAEPQLSDDINVESDQGFPGQVVGVLDGITYLVLEDVEHGRELWRTDGTEAGTRLVKDIWPGSHNGEPSAGVVFNDELYFRAQTAENGRELWKTDGTEAGTQLVKDIYDGSRSSEASDLHVLAGQLFFRADDGVHGSELWVTDGTTLGTQLLVDIQPGENGSYPNQMVEMGGELFFEAAGTPADYELWKTDGTAVGTVLLKDIRAGSGSNPGELTAFEDDKILFTAADGIHGQELWISDGTEIGTQLVADIMAGGSSWPRNIVVLNGEAFFTAERTTNEGTELWKTNGTEAGTKLVRDINPDPQADGISLWETVVPFGNFVYFAANDGSNGIELWKSDGTEAGTVMVRDIDSDGNSRPDDLVVLDNSLYFEARQSTSGYELWKSDGTEAGTVLVKDIQEGTKSSNPNNIYAANGSLLFRADDGVHGYGLWTSDGTEGGTLLVRDTYVGTAGSFPEFLAPLGDSVIFIAEDPEHGSELWTSDGTPDGTFLLKDINPGEDSGYPEFQTRAGDLVFFGADDGVHGFELWATDGTPSGTSMVKDIRPGETGSGAYELFSVGDTLFFEADDGVNGEELWKSDGTEAGTEMVKNIRIGGDSDPEEFFSVGDTLFFAADDGIHGRELWKSDGTWAGTVMVKDITEVGGSSLGELTAVGSLLYFRVSDQLWKSDGTEGGTEMVKVFSNLYELEPSGNVLFLIADDGSGVGEELWKSDGTEVGTSLVKDIYVGEEDSDLYNMTSLNGSVFFSADDGIHGKELWKSDGSSEGTSLVKDINPGENNGGPHAITEVNGVGYFIADDENYDRELWRTDGTSEGTVMISGDVNPYGSSDVDDIETRYNYTEEAVVAAESTIFFVANSRSHGYELWSFNPDYVPFEPVTPDRLLDTRPMADKVGTLAVDGGAAPYELQVTGVGDIPTSGVGAVSLNVTAVNTEANDYGGFVTVYPCGDIPDSSNLNFVTGQTVANSVITPVSSEGKVCFYVYGKADLLVDTSGYLPPGFVPMTPDRLLDTRAGDMVGKLDGSGSAYELQVTGVGDIPSSGVGAVAMNVTAVSTEANDFGGFVTVYPCGDVPDSSNLNFVSGQTIPNSVIAPVSAGGKVCFYVYGKAHLLADVSGYFPTGFVPLTPDRLLDTRAGDMVGKLDGSGSAYELQVTGVGDIPSSGVGAVAMNVTAVSTEANDFGGFVTVYPCGDVPDSSNLNFVSGQTIPNSVIAPVSAGGKVCFYVYGKAHLLADVSGYFPGQS